MSTFRARILAAALFALAAVSLAACEKPDASDVTSPSAIALLGTSIGNVSYAPPESPPPPTLSKPAGWSFDVGNARFSTLENGTPSIQFVTEVQAKPGPGLEIWLSSPTGTVLRWSGGSSHGYDGVVCFQLRLKDKGEALNLDPEQRYTVTLAFRDLGDNSVVVAQDFPVAGQAPRLSGAPPAQGSAVARDLLGCPRSVI